MKTELPHGYWNPKIELMPKGKLRRLQLKRVQDAIRYAWERSPFYRNRMVEHGVTPENILTLEDFFRKFPVTRREDLERDQLANPPFGKSAAVPLNVGNDRQAARSGLRHRERLALGRRCLGYESV